MIFVSNDLHAKQAAPKLPYYNWGACLGEGCWSNAEWHKWRVEQKCNLYANTKQTKIMQKLKVNTYVKALQSVVITRKFGLVKVLNTHVLNTVISGEDGYQKAKAILLKKSDIIYELHFSSEGHYAYWFNGIIFYEAIPDLPGFKVLSEAETTEMVKVRLSNKVTGWVDRYACNLNDFGG